MSTIYSLTCILHIYYYGCINENIKIIMKYLYAKLGIQNIQKCNFIIINSRKIYLIDECFFMFINNLNCSYLSIHLIALQYNIWIFNL